MDDNKRARIVAAIALKRNGQVSNVYDYNRCTYILMNSTILGQNISVLDTNNGYLMGTLPNLFDYPTNSYISINIFDNQFNGWDYQSGTFFNGTIYGNMVLFFDSSKATYFNYSV